MRGGGGKESEKKSRGYVYGGSRMRLWEWECDNVTKSECLTICQHIQNRPPDPSPYPPFPGHRPLSLLT